jgi:lysophospholipase L1-like esterase
MRRLSTISVLLFLTACGGGSPSGPSSPTPTAAPGSPVSGFVFYDENANGFADASEVVRLPGVSVSIGGRTASSTALGRFTVDGVSSGSQNATLSITGLPPYFSQGTTAPVQVPQAPGSSLGIPATLGIGSNKPNVYLGFGDSITLGEGSSDGTGYRSWLEVDLRAQWGTARVEAKGWSGTKSYYGAQRIAGTLITYHPAYVLILYGTNDWNDAECKEVASCYTVSSLRDMVQDAKSAGSLPILATLPPVNPKWVDKGATERNAWAKQMNAEIRKMAVTEQTPVAEVYDLFMAKGDVAALFADTVHPNDEGYRLISQAFQKAITQPRGSSAASRSLFSSPF